MSLVWQSASLLRKQNVQFTQKETDSHASVATLARNDGGGLNSYDL